MTLGNAIGLVGLAGVLAMGCGGGDGESSGANNCSAACAVITTCVMQSTEDCLAQCQGDLSEAAEFGQACVDAVDDLAACIAGGSCADFEAWLDEIPSDSYPCKAQDDAIDEC